MPPPHGGGGRGNTPLRQPTRSPLPLPPPRQRRSREGGGVRLLRSPKAARREQPSPGGEEGPAERLGYPSCGGASRRALSAGRDNGTEPSGLRDAKLREISEQTGRRNDAPTEEHGRGRRWQFTPHSPKLGARSGGGSRGPLRDPTRALTGVLHRGGTRNLSSRGGRGRRDGESAVGERGSSRGRAGSAGAARMCAAVRGAGEALPRAACAGSRTAG